MIQLETQQDLENLIENQVEENLQLEYKRAEALEKTETKRKEIAKDISSMANSAGGIIIYGIKEYDESDKRHLPERIMPINRPEFSKEWLEQVINSGIQPRIDNIKIQSISIDTGADHIVYVVSIPQSSTAHQAVKEHRYYKRFNFLAEPMDDYEIRDIMSREKTPRVILKFKIEKRTFLDREFAGMPMLRSIGINEPQKKVRTKLIVSMYNEGTVVASVVNSFAKVPADILGEKDIKVIILNGIEYGELYKENTIRDVIGTSGVYPHIFPQYGPSRFDPILPQRYSYKKEFFLVEEPLLDERKIYWQVHADNASVREGELALSEIEIIEIDETEDSKVI